MAVVKADGFGHGAADVARTALSAGASWLGVTTIDEAIALRRRGLAAPMLSWLNPVDADFGAAIAAGIDLAVPSREHLDAVAPIGDRRPRPPPPRHRHGPRRGGARAVADPVPSRAAGRSRAAGCAWSG